MSVVRKILGRGVNGLGSPKPATAIADEVCALGSQSWVERHLLLYKMRSNG